MFNSISYFSPFPFQNVPTLFLEGKGDGSQLLFDFTYFKVYISILSPRFFAFDCIWMFLFSRRRKLLRHGLKRTMHLPIWIQGWRRNTSTSSQGIQNMDEFSQTNPNFDCRFYQCFESIQLYGVSLVQLVDDLEGGRLVGREQEILKTDYTWKGAHCEET